jgi:hypothetical protein
MSKLPKKQPKKQPEWTPMYTVLGNFRGYAWRRDSIYTSYLLYVEPWGEC